MTGLHKESGPWPREVQACVQITRYKFGYTHQNLQNNKENLSDQTAKEKGDMLPHPRVPSVVPRTLYSVLETTLLQGRIEYWRG